jgi:hypothetical protein
MPPVLRLAVQVRPSALQSPTVRLSVPLALPRLVKWPRIVKPVLTYLKLPYLLILPPRMMKTRCSS